MTTVSGLSKKWKLFNMPIDMEGKTFCEVGCWDGSLCVEALRRGAKHAIGIDMCVCEGLKRNIAKFGFDFVQLDIFSESFLRIMEYDVVSCNGVLYHVENPMSLLSRLRRITKGLLVLETKLYLSGNRPIMTFLDEESCWWAPNQAGLRRMLSNAKFGNIKKVIDFEKKDDFCRACFHAVPIMNHNYKRIAPRASSYMETGQPDLPIRDKK